MALQDARELFKQHQKSTVDSGRLNSYTHHRHEKPGGPRLSDNGRFPRSKGGAY